MVLSQANSNKQTKDRYIKKTTTFAFHKANALKLRDFKVNLCKFFNESEIIGITSRV